MQHVPVTHLLWLLFAGLLAGFEVAVHYGIAAPASFGEAELIASRQALIRRLRVLAPALFLPSFLLTLLIASRSGMKRDPGYAGQRQPHCWYGSSSESCGRSR